MVHATTVATHERPPRDLEESRNRALIQVSGVETVSARRRVVHREWFFERGEHINARLVEFFTASVVEVRVLFVIILFPY